MGVHRAGEELPQLRRSLPTRRWFGRYRYSLRTCGCLFHKRYFGRDNSLNTVCNLYLMLSFSLTGEGKLVHRLLCHSSDVTSVSWCPVPYNVLQLGKDGASLNEKEFMETDKTFLLASCCHDLTIYVSRAGTDSNCETLIKLPSKAVGNNSRLWSGITEWFCTLQIVILYVCHRFSTKRFHTPNNERGRMLKWIYPSVMVTSTNFDEMVSVHLLKFDSKSSLVEDKIMYVIVLSSSLLILFCTNFVIFTQVFEFTNYAHEIRHQSYP